MDDIEEFAPEYTAKERTRILVLGMVLGTLAVCLGKTWVSPWFAQFVKMAPCRSYAGYPGTDLLFYGLFVGLPSLAILPLLSLTWTGYRILRDRQAPPPGAKVYRKTRIAKGRRALLKGALLLLIVPVLGVPLVTWGYFQAAALSHSAQAKTVDLAVCKAIDTTGPAAGRDR